MQMMHALLVDYSVGYGNSYILCSEYAAEHQLLYNCSKLFYLCFGRKDLKAHHRFSSQIMIQQCRFLGKTIAVKKKDLDLKHQMKKNVY